MGVVLGTAAYMAPEQAKGQLVDKRADIWAFGLVLYEMLTGARPFTGDDASEVLAAILRQEIDWAPLPAATPPGIRQLLRRCLERKPKDRLHDIADARIAIHDVLTKADEPATAASGAARTQLQICRPGRRPRARRRRRHRTLHAAVERHRRLEM